METGGHGKGQATLVQHRIRRDQANVTVSVNMIERRYRPYLVEARAASGASPEAAVATAAHDTLVELVQTQGTNIDAAYKTSMDAIAEGSAKSNGVAAGRAAAAAILLRRIADGSTTMGTWSPGILPVNTVLLHPPTPQRSCRNGARWFRLRCEPVISFAVILHPICTPTIMRRNLTR